MVGGEYEGGKLAEGVVERCREGSRMVEREGRDHKREGSWDESRTIIKFGVLIFMYVHDWMYMYLCSKLEGGTISCLESS